MICPAREVQVWRIPLDLDPETLAVLSDLLDPLERARAGRFRFERDRRRFIAARGRLRQVLSRYSGGRPEALRFRYGPHGKPELEPEDRSDSLRFNLSHAHELALLAVARGRDVGVDLEWSGREVEALELAERFFSRAEARALWRLPEPRRAAAFFRCWTRKEAYIKARGEGLSLPLDAFDVSLARGHQSALLATRGDPEEAARWRIRDLPAGPGYVAAVAARGRGWRMRRRGRV
jgi:4'-phosphopantetheinyl transferase